MTFFIKHVGQNLQTVVRLECEMPGQRPVKSCCDGSYVSCRGWGFCSPILIGTNALPCQWKRISMQNTFCYEFIKNCLSKWIFNFMQLLHCWALSPQPGQGTILLWPKRFFWDTGAFREHLAQTVPRLHTPRRRCWSTVCRTGLALRAGDCF